MAKAFVGSFGLVNDVGAHNDDPVTRRLDPIGNSARHRKCNRTTRPVITPSPIDSVGGGADVVVVVAITTTRSSSSSSFFDQVTVVLVVVVVRAAAAAAGAAPSICRLLM
jgi:hypothetical protein